MLYRKAHFRLQRGYEFVCAANANLPKSKPSSILSQAVMGFNLALNWTISLTNHYVCVHSKQRDEKAL